MSDDLLARFRAASGVSTDTRTVRRGELFFALRGPNFDGNRYAEAALREGASLAVVDDPAVATDERFYLVDDALEALQSLARAYRRTWTIPVFALTGSNGKTTTKELLTAMLATTYRVHATAGNLNNHIGVPLTLLRSPSDAEAAVIEMGANHQREIAALCAIAEPTHGLITNIGRAHLEGFGGLEGVRIGKGELFDYLAESGGRAFYDVDDAEVAALAARVPSKLPYGTSSGAKPTNSESLVISGALERDFPTVKCRLATSSARVSVEARLPGDYNYRNLVAAAAVASYFKVPLRSIARAASAYRPSASRSEQRTRNGSPVLFDAYNANPDSLAAALRWLASRPETRKIAVLGELREQGAYAKTAHADALGAALAIEETEVAVFGGGYAEAVVAPEAQGRVARFTEVGPLADWLDARTGGPDAVVLIKGSRGNRLERLLD